MYERVLEKGGRVRRFTITSLDFDGWEVREEEGSRVLRRTCYTDWHKVERAQESFTREASSLTGAGWKES